jgi:UDPglucose 6-dehydrogenase
MILGVIGLGVVGSAYKKGLQKWGHKVIGYDIKFKSEFSNILETSVIFLCVPSPSRANGSANTSIIESVLNKLNDCKYKNLVVICSTVPPGFTNRMQRKYKKIKICCVPELLRERLSFKDFVNNRVVVVGVDNNYKFKIVKKCFPKKFELKKFSFEEAEIFKYLNNSLAALRVVYANIFYELCQKYKSNYKKIKDAYIQTGKINDLYLNVSSKLRGYAGVCLPKDVKALEKVLREKKLNFKLISAINQDNLIFKKTVFPGMRK